MPNTSGKRDAAQSAWQAVVQARLGNLPHGAHEDRASLVELAEIEVEAMRESFARALELRNATASPACRLPPETLANIFSYLQAIWPTRLRRDESVNHTDDSIDDREAFYFTRAWYNVAHVCHLWREAASTPLLWCTISCTDLPPNFMPIVMSRTRGLPMTLSVRSFPLGDNVPKMLELTWRARLVESARVWFTAPVLRRIERFAFEDGFQKEDLALCQSFLRHPTPALKELTILATSSQSQSTLHHPPFKSDEYPLSSLRRLSLTNCQLLEPATRGLLTSNITHLAIINSPGNRCIVEKLYPSIASMVHLEELTLVNCYPKQEDYLESPDVLHLPSCLRVVRLSADYDELSPDAINDALRFVDHLSIPPTAYALVRLKENDLFVDDEDSEDDDPEDWVDDVLLDATVAALFAINDLDSTSESRELNISFNAYDIRRARASPFIPPRLYPETCPGGRAFSLSCLCGHCLKTTLLGQIQSLSQTLPMIESISLQLSSWFASPGQNWWKHLLPASGVHTLSVEWSVWYCNDLWSTMSIPMASSDVLFPVLETIVIHEHGISVDSYSSFARVAGTFIDMLHTRKDRQVPVRNVFVDEKLRHWSIWSLVAEVTPVTFFTPEKGE